MFCGPAYGHVANTGLPASAEDSYIVAHEQPWLRSIINSSVMKIVFCDPAGWDYDVTTPRNTPLGGSQSLLCYLAVELARRGHHITLANGVARPLEVQGVHCVPLNPAVYELPCDALVLLNGPAEMAMLLRTKIPSATRIALWAHHSFDQPAMEALGDPSVRDAWDAVICISQWQRTEFVARFGLDPSRVWLLRNAIAPMFADMFASPEELIAAKPLHPALCYTSTPFRGLETL
jgi:hypothetical protein